jgi:hypothetical protein
MKYRGEYMQIEISNLSEKGAYVVAPTTPHLDDGVTLVIEVPEHGMSFMVTGRVKRVGLGSRVLQRQSGFGIEFTRFYSSAGKSTLSNHIYA